MKKQRTPQEKKQLSYERDQRNVYGNSPHAARTGIPLRKALRNRANRHNANQQLDYKAEGFDEDLADAIESRLQHKPENDWKKDRDRPLGEVIARKSRDRATMRKAGGRSALIVRGYYGTRPTRAAPGSEVFADYILDALREAKILGVRSGIEHRYTGVWVVVVDKRVFVRSWNDKPTGWYRAFKNEPVGMIQAGELEVAVRAKTVRSVRTRDAVTAAIAEKYPTKGSRKWVEGFAEPERVHTTIEFIPE